MSLTKPAGPLWLRIYILAAQQGVAGFDQGELCDLFGVPSSTISNAIRRAKDLGLLAEKSSSRVLIANNFEKENW